jgi:hypothetical protein
LRVTLIFLFKSDLSDITIPSLNSQANKTLMVSNLKSVIIWLKSLNVPIRAVKSSGLLQ